jgi:NAD(P)-dependent dehydrogenase (short-subunit alcohol dehydrogenase family)
MSTLDQFCAGKIAVVTGAGSGIGRAIAQELDQHGARVHCADINGEAAAAVAAGLRDAQAHTLDVSDAAAVGALADVVYERDGRVDLLFNNAGIGHAALMVDTELADWRRVIDVNLMGVVHGVHAFLPRMLKQSTPSHIVNTASGAGLFPHPRMALYTAAKHAVVGLSTSLAAELEGNKVGVTVLCPGIINTAITQNILTSGETSAHRAQTIAFYEKNGASPEKVARDLLNDVRRNKLFCLSPRIQVGAGWLLYRLSPRLAIAAMRGQIKKVMGTGN